MLIYDLSHLMAVIVIGFGHTNVLWGTLMTEADLVLALFMAEVTHR